LGCFRSTLIGQALECRVKVHDTLRHLSCAFEKPVGLAALSQPRKALFLDPTRFVRFAALFKRSSLGPTLLFFWSKCAPCELQGKHQTDYHSCKLAAHWIPQ